jgi:hypothetical protein
MQCISGMPRVTLACWNALQCTPGAASRQPKPKPYTATMALQQLRVVGRGADPAHGTRTEPTWQPRGTRVRDCGIAHAHTACRSSIPEMKRLLGPESWRCGSGARGTEPRSAAGG